MSKVRNPEQILIDEQLADEEIWFFNAPGCCPDCDYNQSVWDEYQIKQKEKEMKKFIYIVCVVDDSPTTKADACPEFYRTMVEAEDETNAYIIGSNTLFPTEIPDGWMMLNDWVIPVDDIETTYMPKWVKLEDILSEIGD